MSLDAKPLADLLAQAHRLKLTARMPVLLSEHQRRYNSKDLAYNKMYQACLRTLRERKT